MVNLEKLICSQVSEEARDFYASLRNNNEEGNGFVNASFELIIQPDDEKDLKMLFNEL